VDSLCYTGKYDEGVEAFRNGKTMEDNPYPSDSYNHGAWSQGWFDTMVEQGSGNDYVRLSSIHDGEV
jgi:hypothetical protein